MAHLKGYSCQNMVVLVMSRSAHEAIRRSLADLESDRILHGGRRMTHWARGAQQAVGHQQPVLRACGRQVVQQHRCRCLQCTATTKQTRLCRAGQRSRRPAHLRLLYSNSNSSSTRLLCGAESQNRTKQVGSKAHLRLFHPMARSSGAALVMMVCHQNW